jgi:Fur family transcriptional regulator, ferric uptake regulator
MGGRKPPYRTVTADFRPSLRVAGVARPHVEEYARGGASWPLFVCAKISPSPYLLTAFVEEDGALKDPGEETQVETGAFSLFRERLSAHMAKKGLRSTDQRRLIVETFFLSPNHISIEELLAVVRVEDPKVGYATVYRTLKLLTECGVAFERKFGDGLTRYELADEDTHHDHLICVECGKIAEFEDPEIEVLQEAIAKKHGYVLRSHKHEMYGICPDCQELARRAIS